MPIGTVKWFNLRKGYGFIVPDDGGPDIFLSARSLERANLPRLEPGMALHYTLGGKAGKAFAEHLSQVEPVVREAPPPQAPRAVAGPIDTDAFEREWGLRR